MYPLTTSKSKFKKGLFPLKMEIKNDAKLKYSVIALTNKTKTEQLNFLFWVDITYVSKQSYSGLRAVIYKRLN